MDARQRLFGCKKIKAELEFQAKAETGTNHGRPSAHPAEPVQTEGNPVRTSADVFEPVRTGADALKLEAEIESLRFDKLLDKIHSKSKKGHKKSQTFCKTRPWFFVYLLWS